MTENIYLFTSSELAEMAERYECLARIVRSGLLHGKTDVMYSLAMMAEIKEIGIIMAKKLPPEQKEDILKKADFAENPPEN